MICAARSGGGVPPPPPDRSVAQMPGAARRGTWPIAPLRDAGRVDLSSIPRAGEAHSLTGGGGLWPARRRTHPPVHRLPQVSFLAVMWVGSQGMVPALG